MNVILKAPIRISATETLPVGRVVPASVLGTSLQYLLDRGCVAVATEKPAPEPPKETEPVEPEPGPPASKKRF